MTTPLEDAVRELRVQRALKERMAFLLEETRRERRLREAAVGLMARYTADFTPHQRATLGGESVLCPPYSPAVGFLYRGHALLLRVNSDGGWWLNEYFPGPGTIEYIADLPQDDLYGAVLTCLSRLEV